MFGFGKKNRLLPYFALECTDDAVRVMQIGQKKSSEYVHGCAVEYLPPGAIRNGVIEKPHVVIDAIHAARKKAKITTKNVVCVLPKQKSFLCITTLPKMTQQEMHTAVAWDITSLIPLAVDQICYDWQILPHTVTKAQNTVRVLIVAVGKHDVDAYKNMLTDGGLTVYGFELDAMAQSASLLGHARTDGATMIIDIGKKDTDFIIAVQNAPIFVSRVPFSTDMMVQAVMQRLRVPHTHAKKMLKTHGVGVALKDNHLFHAVQPVVDGIIKEAQKCMDFHHAGLYGAQHIDHIVISGRGAQIMGLQEYITHQLDGTVICGNPWTHVHHAGLFALKHNACAHYATVIGAAKAKKSFMKMSAL